MTAFLTGKGGRRRPPAVSRAGIAVLAAVLALGLAAVLPRAGALAARTPAPVDAGQVRLFQNGVFIGGGTLVAPNWVLTVAHIFDRPDNPGPYTLRFGDTDNAGDPGSQENLRQVDRPIVLAQQGDMALVHFAQAVPYGTYIPVLAQQQPASGAEARLYGWGRGTAGTTLDMATGVVTNPSAAEQAAWMRERGSEQAIFAFPVGINPMITSAPVVPGDSGSGVFVDANTLTGVHATRVVLTGRNAAGNVTSRTSLGSWEEPVWEFRVWIEDTINGAGTSSSGPPVKDELRRKLLADDSTAGPPALTNPPQSLSCTDGDPSCTEPATATGTLTAPADTPGLTPVACADASPVDCTIDGNYVPPVPTQENVHSGQQVEAWCQGTAVLGPGAAPQAVVEVSFTNTDPAQPVGYGWWDISPASIQTTAGPLDPAALPPCPAQPSATADAPATPGSPAAAAP